MAENHPRMQEVIRTSENGPAPPPPAFAEIASLAARARAINLSLHALCLRAEPPVAYSTVARWLAGAGTPLLSNLIETASRLRVAVEREEDAVRWALTARRRR
jgi:hypothetical protein